MTKKPLPHELTTRRMSPEKIPSESDWEEVYQALSDKIPDHKTTNQDIVAATDAVFTTLAELGWKPKP